MCEIMKPKRVLNLYSGLGGNRKLWSNVEVTAVENNKEIANIYQDFFPDDKVVIADAHQYLLDHYNDGWDFIWSSPPCPTHSRIKNIAGVGRGQDKPVYPDMRLYQEIIFLKQIYISLGCDFEGCYAVENVNPYYTPLINPQIIGRHCIWANYSIPDVKINPLPEKSRCSIPGLKSYYGFELPEKCNIDKKTVLRNCVNPKLGLHIFNCAFKLKQSTL